MPRVFADIENSSLRRPPYRYVARRTRLWENRDLFLMSLPSLILLFIFSYLPMLGIIIAFKDFRYDLGFFRSPWAGLRNFEFFFTSQDAWRITRNTIGLNLLFIAMGTVFSVGFALLLRELTGKFLLKFYQTTYFFPHFLSWVVVGYALFAFLNMQLGIVNTWIKAFGGSPVAWYSNPVYWPFILVIVFLWKNVGYFCLIYYAAVIGIDPEYYEAAAIDGASRWQMIFKISIPLIKPVIVIMILLQIGRILYADFGMFYNLPMDVGMLYPATDVIDTYVYRALRVSGDIGMASAAGFFQAVVGLAIIWLSNYVTGKINPDNALF